MTVRQRTYEILELSVPGDLLRNLVDITLVTLIAANVIAVILESVPGAYAGNERLFTGFEVLSVLVFTVEYLARLWCVAERPVTDETDPGPWVRRRRYAASLPALIDLIAIAPFFLLHFGVLSGLDLRFLRALRLLRIFKLTRYSQTMTLLMAVLRDNVRTLGAVLVVLVIVMILAASGMYLFEHKAQPRAFAHIPAAMWWAFVTLTTVGYGDVVPVTVGGRIFGAAITVVGVGMVALPAGILASAFSAQIRLREMLYTSEVERALRDGVITQSEERNLEHVRRSLGLSESSASLIRARPGGEVSDVAQSPAPVRSGAMAEPPRAAKPPGGAPCPHCGACGEPWVA